jgi:hypothetical protein
MAQVPAFTSTPRMGIATVSVANAARDGTGTIVDVLTGVAAGTKVFEVVVKATGDLADSTVTLFISPDGGTTNHIWDEIDVGDPVAGSTTVASYRGNKTWDNLVLPSATHRLRAAITVAPTAGTVRVYALGGDLT